MYPAYYLLSTVPGTGYRVVEAVLASYLLVGAVLTSYLVVEAVLMDTW